MGNSSEQEKKKQGYYLYIVLLALIAFIGSIFYLHETNTENQIISWLWNFIWVAGIPILIGIAYFEGKKYKNNLNDNDK